MDETSEARVGVLLGSQIFDLAGTAIELGQALPSSLLDLGPKGLDAAREVAAEATRRDLQTVVAASLRLLAPLPRPRNVPAVVGHYVNYAGSGWSSSGLICDESPVAILHAII